jgi:hypothetical protein
MEIVANHTSTGHKLRFADMYNDAGLNHDRSDLIDGVHPNPVAYEKLSPVWADSITTPY